MKIRYLLILLAGLYPFALCAQPVNIQIGGQFNEWTCEPSVCMNPSNPDEIMVGSVLDNYYSSNDGGFNWQHGTISSSYGVNGDPVILADTAGRFYYFHLVPDLSRVVCHKKESLNAPWSTESYTAVYNTYDIDKEWAAYDPVTNNLYASIPGVVQTHKTLSIFFWPNQPMAAYHGVNRNSSAMLVAMPRLGFTAYMAHTPQRVPMARYMFHGGARRE
jgi:hypothetical protein